MLTRNKKTMATRITIGDVDVVVVQTGEAEAVHEVRFNSKGTHIAKDEVEAEMHPTLPASTVINLDITPQIALINYSIFKRLSKER